MKWHLLTTDAAISLQSFNSWNEKNKKQRKNKQATKFLLGHKKQQWGQHKYAHHSETGQQHIYRHKDAWERAHGHPYSKPHSASWRMGGYYLLLIFVAILPFSTIYTFLSSILICCHAELHLLTHFEKDCKIFNGFFKEYLEFKTMFKIVTQHSWKKLFELH